ncbi:MAG: hypothetical protein QXY10_02350, partial [Candidatus Micrarchaeaceae archaeon]
MATIEDVRKIELRVGKIIEVKDLDSRKPMYALKVYFGEKGIKNIAAGIKEYYGKEELIGKNIVVVFNLDSKKIGKFVSEGMLLAAESNGKIALIV